MLKYILQQLGLEKISDKPLSFRQPSQVFNFNGGKSDVSSILDLHKNYIKQLKIALPYNDAEFERWVKPIIIHIAEYYLLLPSSFEQHHREAGGAFTHSVQTAIAAVSILKQDSGYYNQVPGELRHSHQYTIPLAICILALVHDTGKPITDFDVYACDRTGIINTKIDKWEPTIVSIRAWAKKNKVKYYRPYFFPVRLFKEHEKHTVNEIAKILPLLKNFKNKPLLQTVINNSLHSLTSPSGNALLSIVQESDAKSARYDMMTYGRLPRETTHSCRFFDALQTHYFDAPSENESISSIPYFWSNLGLHINYPIGLEKIIQTVFSIHKSHSPQLNDKFPSEPISVVRLLANCHHLISLDLDNENFIDNIYVKLNSEVNPSKHSLHKIKVITIKQPHLLKVLKNKKTYTCHLSPNQKEIETIPLSAMGVNEGNEFYDELAKEASIDQSSVNNKAPDTEINSTLTDQDHQPENVTTKIDDNNLDHQVNIDFNSNDEYSDSIVDPHIKRFLTPDALNKLNGSNDDTSKDNVEFLEIGEMCEALFPQSSQHSKLNILVASLTALKAKIVDRSLTIETTDSDDVSIGRNENGLFIKKDIFVNPLFNISNKDLFQLTIIINDAVDKSSFPFKTGVGRSESLKFYLNNDLAKLITSDVEDVVKEGIDNV
jgi:hypothetical protein